jgi:hypothetical protein
VTSAGENAPPPGPEAPRTAGQFPSPDALLTVSGVVRAARDPDIRVEPAWKASLVYGMPCAVYHQFPAAYYLAGRFQDDFESAVLHAVNGGGQNQARAMLTGALCGAIGGIQAIPARWNTARGGWNAPAGWPARRPRRPDRPAARRRQRTGRKLKNSRPCT